jgi:hypothetical protein
MHYIKAFVTRRMSEPTITIEEVTDPIELAKAHRLREQFDRNSAWLEAHAHEVYSKHRGKVICIAGEELFVGDTAREVIDQATKAHPDDDGWFTRYIHKEKLPAVYAN